METLHHSMTFMLIFFGYLLIASCIFTTLYHDMVPRYSNLMFTLRSLFDAAMGVYEYTGLENFFISHSCLIVIHVFMSNIVLMNFFIALLSKIYEDGMDTIGEFGFLTNKY